MKLVMKDGRTCRVINEFDDMIEVLFDGCTNTETFDDNEEFRSTIAYITIG